MVSQEKLYGLLQQERWEEIIHFLYQYKVEIAKDLLLRQAAEIFEQVFFQKINTHSPVLADELDILETIFLLHKGNFYKVSEPHFEQLITAIIKIKPLDEAYKYALLMPELEICKAVIERYKELEAFKPKNQDQVQMNTKNWIEVYNRLFELINVQGNTATYYSGPKFIDTIREFDPYFPTYKQYIDLRNGQGKSTSRKIFYYDILLELTQEMRTNVLARILSILAPHEPDQVAEIQSLLGISQQRDETVQKAKKDKDILDANSLKVFISYSWDSEEHKIWVEKLAKELSRNGIYVFLDQYDLHVGKSIPHFAEQSIANADRIIIVFTPNYKIKAENRSGGVGYEYSIMNAALYANQTENEKIIPILRQGTMADSMPSFMHQYIHINFSNDQNFDNSVRDLVREIYNSPMLVRPQVGKKPDFLA